MGFYPKEKSGRRVMRPMTYENDRHMPGHGKQKGMGQAIEEAKQQRELKRPDGSK